MKFVFLLATMFLWTNSSAQSFELIVLGSAQDAGYPQIGCSKACCAEIEKTEGVASIAIESEGKFWIIDATPDFTEQFNRCQTEFPESKFAGVFLTHAHIGHYTGLMYLGLEAMNSKDIPVYCMPKMAEFLRTNGPWSQLVEKENIKIVEMKENEAIRISAYASVTPLIVPHRDEFSETVGFIIASEKKKALYIPDINKWNQWSQSILGLLDAMDVVLIDATFYDGAELPGRDMSKIPHPFVVESMELFKDLARKEKSKIYFTHFNHTNPLLKNGEKRKKVLDAGYNIALTGSRL